MLNPKLRRMIEMSANASMLLMVVSGIIGAQIGARLVEHVSTANF